MSLLDVINKPTAPDEDHIAIITHKAFHPTLHGGWNEWFCGCVCGWMDRGPGFIPAEATANRVFQRHYEQATGITAQPIELEDDPQEALREWAARFLEAA